MGWQWDMKDEIPKNALDSKPFETPKDYKHPTLGEQFRYALKRHPYYRYGYAIVLGIGGLAYCMLPSDTSQNSVEKKAEKSTTE
ncbi:hypothetical protein BSKO_03222 [Bryopsis sp. KO-2023]|nr:hypothetical protein BSKO_03222 [Bryopsis sp. KO-2023]